MSDAPRPNSLSLGALIGPDADYGGADATIGVARPVLDSRKAAAGDVFFALAGAKANGAQFIADAVAHGGRRRWRRRGPIRGSRVP
jgi:UDP-N-acetylmuramoyl-L-alanyl-D-glutamate--2,6-diaminopimelate ligase